MQLCQSTCESKSTRKKSIKFSQSTESINFPTQDRIGIQVLHSGVLCHPCATIAGWPHHCCLHHNMFIVQSSTTSVPCTPKLKNQHTVSPFINTLKKKPARPPPNSQTVFKQTENIICFELTDLSIAIGSTSARLAPE